jgi:glycosyltransferase involved in cell wall biosynthesis
MNDGTGNEFQQILISIIIATFNAEEYLRLCLESITSLEEKNIEIVVVDGGSRDNTISIIKDFPQINLVWISEPDKGIYDALNKGTRLAKGKWLYFLGADDRLLPGFSEMASKLKDENTVYYGNSEPFYYGTEKPSYELLVGKFSNYRLAKYSMNHQAIIYPAKAFYKYEYSLRYKVFADYALNIQLWGDRNFKKIFYPFTIVSYNMTGFSSTINDIEFKKDKPMLIRQSMGLLMYIKFIFKRFKKRLRGETDFD